MRFLKTNLKNKNRGADYCIFYALLILIVFATPIFAQTQESDSIRVGEYATFLEARASYDDASEFYNAAMKDLIVQTWSEDHFDYQVAQGVDENEVLSYLTEKQIACYESWFENELPRESSHAITQAEETPTAPLMMEWGGKESGKTAADSQRESLQRGSTQSRDGLSMDITKPSSDLHGFQRAPQCLLSYYKKADTLWSNAAEAWSKLATIQEKSEKRQAVYEQACERREEEDRLYRAKDLKKTWLGWASSKLGGAASSAANVPDPHAQTASGVARTVSMALGAANKALAKKDLWYAQVREKRAESKASRSEKKLEKIQETAPDLEYQAQLAEDEIAIKELEQSIRDAKRCQEERPQDGKEIWQQRVKNSEAELQALERTEHINNKTLSQNKKSFDDALDRVRDLQKKLNEAQASANDLELEKTNLLLASEQACTDYTLAKAEYDECHDKKIISTKREDKEQKKKAWIQFQADLKKCCDQREKLIQEIASQKEIVVTATLRKKEAQQVHDDLEAHIKRSRERSAKRLEADRLALRSIWPEESDVQRTINAWKNLDEAQNKKEGYEQALEELKAVRGDVEGIIKREQNIAEKKQVLRQQEALFEIEQEIKKLTVEKKKDFLQQEEKIAAQQVALNHENDDLNVRIKALQQEREHLQEPRHDEAEEVELKKEFVELQERVINQDQEVLIQKETDLAIEKEDLDHERAHLAFQIDVLSQEKEVLETKEKELEEHSKTNLPTLNQEQEKEEQQLKERRAALQQSLLEQAYHEIATLRERAKECFVKAEKAKVEGEETKESGILYTAGENFNKAADNLEKATEAEVANNLEGAKIWRRSANAYLESAELTERDKKNESAQLYREIGEVLGDQWDVNFADAYQKTIDQGKEDSQAAAAWKKYIEVRMAQVDAIEKQINALSRQDQTAVILHKQAAETHGKVATAFKGAAWAYENFAEELNGSDSTILEIYQQAAEAYYQAAESLQAATEADDQDKKTVARYQRNLSLFQSNVGNSLNQLVSYNKYSNNAEDVESCQQYINAFHQAVKNEQKAIAAFQSDRTDLASCYDSLADAYNSQGCAYDNALLAKNEKAIADIYKKQAYAYEQQIEALEKQLKILSKDDQAITQIDRKATRLHEVIAKDFKDAAAAYERAVEQKANDNSKLEKVYLKLAEMYEKEAAALKRSDTESAILYCQNQRILNNYSDVDVLKAYQKTIDQEKDNPKAAAWNGYIEARMSQIAAIEKQIDALSRKDQAAVTVHEQIGEAFGRSAKAYENFAKELNENDSTIAEIYENAAWAYHQAAESLQAASKSDDQDKKTVAEYQKNLSLLQNKLGSSFNELVSYKQSNNAEDAESCLLYIIAFMEAVINHQKAIDVFQADRADLASYYENLASACCGSGCSYDNALIKKDEKAIADIYKQQAHAYAQQAEALEEQLKILSKDNHAITQLDREASTRHEKAATAFKGAVQAYALAIDQKRKSNSGIEKVYLKLAKVYEKEAKALQSEDKKNAELYRQIEGILLGCFSLSLADAYQKVTDCEKENQKASTAWNKYIEVRMAQVEEIEKQIYALSHQDQDTASLHEENAAIHGKIATALEGVAKAYEKKDESAALLYEKQAQDNATAQADIAQKIIELNKRK